MKKIYIAKTLSLAAFACALTLSPLSSTALFGAGETTPIRIGVVNFKHCVEKSKAGKHEQGNFEAFKKQLEEVLVEKEKALTELSSKLNDPDYLDSISRDAESELKHKFRSLNQEMNQYQSQYYQALQQANFKIIQGITEMIAEASREVAKKEHLDLVLNEESGFFYASSMDISGKVVEAMDVLFEKMPKDASKLPPRLP